MQIFTVFPRSPDAMLIEGTEKLQKYNIYISRNSIKSTGNRGNKRNAPRVAIVMVM